MSKLAPLLTVVLGVAVYGLVLVVAGLWLGGTVFEVLGLGLDDGISLALGYVGHAAFNVAFLALLGPTLWLAGAGERSWWDPPIPLARR